MSILFTLVTFLLFIAVTYLRSARKSAAGGEQAVVFAPPPVPTMVRDAGLEIPDGYAFHPGHTWVLAEDRQQARIGLDSFGANLLGKVERVEVPGLNRWIGSAGHSARTSAHVAAVLKINANSSSVTSSTKSFSLDVVCN